MAEQELEFEWDQAKAKSNLEKHGVSFLAAAAIFQNERLERVDDREDYGEVRWIALGRVDIEVYRVIYTWRAENLVRIVSAQRASKDEEEIYYREIFP
ncbi:MAG: BrnT family toxin [Terracidiphilus sp.]